MDRERRSLRRCLRWANTFPEAPGAEWIARWGYNGILILSINEESYSSIRSAKKNHTIFTCVAGPARVAETSPLRPHTARTWSRSPLTDCLVVTTAWRLLPRRTQGRGRDWRR